MPAFAAAYGIGDRGWGRRPADDEIVMMLPAFRSFIPGKMLLIVRNVAVRLPSTDACHPSSVVSSSGPGSEWLPPHWRRGFRSARVLVLSGGAWPRSR